MQIANGLFGQAMTQTLTQTLTQIMSTGSWRVPPEEGWRREFGQRDKGDLSAVRGEWHNSKFRQAVSSANLMAAGALLAYLLRIGIQPTRSGEQTVLQLSRLSAAASMKFDKDCRA